MDRLDIYQAIFYKSKYSLQDAKEWLEGYTILDESIEETETYYKIQIKPFKTYRSPHSKVEFSRIVDDYRITKIGTHIWVMHPK